MNTLNKETITQKVMHIVKDHAIVSVWTDGQTYGLTEQEGFSEVLVGILSDNPYSEYYSEFLVSTGMLDSHLPVEYVNQARIEKRDGSTELASFEKEVAVDTHQVVIETGGRAETTVLLVREEDLGEMKEGLQLDFHAKKEFVMETNDVNFIGDYSVWKVATRSASQTLKGDLVVIPQKASLVEHVEDHLKFNLDSYAEADGEELSVKTSIQSRPKMAASSGKELDLFGGFRFVETNPVSYNFLDGESTEGVEYVFDWNGQAKKFLVLEEDFTVRLEQEIVAPNFKQDGSVEMMEQTQVFEKPATDGSSYLDSGYAKAKGVRKDLQVRVTPVIKGMLNITEDLEARTGYTAIFFGGAVKGDPARYLKESDLTTFVLGEARDEREPEEDYWMLSNQLVRDLAILEESTLDVLERDTKELLQKAYAQDTDALSVFIGLDEREEPAEGESMQLDSENLTVSMFNANPESFMQSDMMRKRLSDFIRPASREVENAGRYYSSDSSYRHMVSDPYEVIRHLEQGNMAIDTLVSKDMKGIAPGHIISNSVSGGQFKLDDRKAILGRFPLLHHLEIQVVNEEGPTFLDEESRGRYENLFAKGQAEGLIYYSLYDMTAEGQSGADFDGDTTMVIRNKDLTDLVESQPKFLDYSYLDGELVEGVPWKEDSSMALVDIIGAKNVQTLENKGVRYHHGTFTFHKDLLHDKTVRELIYLTIVRLDGITNERNNIGRFTNINASVTELIMVLKEKAKAAKAAGADTALGLLLEEIKGYEKLNLLLASAIRWEIDKAKHGGQFYEELAFLDFLMNPPKKNRLTEGRRLEETYDLKMLRLFEGFENMNDKLNKELGQARLGRVHLKRDDDFSSELNMSKSVYLAKGINKGAVYGSRYDNYIEEMKAIAATQTSDFKMNEYKRGLMDEAMAYVDMMRKEGVELDLESNYEAKMSVERGATIDNPTRLLFSYRKQMRDISDEINKMEQTLIQELEERAGGQMLNADSLGLEALMKKVKLPEAQRKDGYELLARKELVIDEHKGLGEAFTSNNPKESALLFAELYLANIRAQNNSRSESLSNERLVNNLRQEALEFLGRKWQEKKGNAQPTAKEIANIKQWVDEYVEDEIYNDTGWGSIITLFPLGAVQFLEFIHDGSIQTDSAKGKNVVVYMELEQGGGIPQNLRTALQDMEGRRVTFDNGKWSGFKIDKEDLGGRNKQVNATQADLKHLNHVTEKEKIAGLTFERGAHLWNRRRSGRVLLAVVYKEGVKLFMEDSMEVAPSAN